MTIDVSQTREGFGVDVMQFARVGMSLEEVCAALNDVGRQLAAYMEFNR